MPILEVKNLYKNFGSTKVLKDISFSLERGKALAIIGLVLQLAGAARPVRAKRRSCAV